MVLPGLNKVSHSKLFHQFSLVPCSMFCLSFMGVNLCTCSYQLDETWRNDKCESETLIGLAVLSVKTLWRIAPP